LKTEFLSITSHQLRTPLSGIKGYLSMMADGDFGPFSQEQGDIIGRVKAEVDRLVRMVQDFLNVSRIESGRLQINMLEFNIVDVAKTVIKELEPSAKGRKLKLELDAEKENIPIKADPDKLKDVIMNLTDNAIKYTEQGKVWLEISCTPDKQVKVSVNDTGVGVDPEEIDKLFNKFQRAKGIARISPGGTGLGLFIAKKIIGAHQGEIWAESRGKGRGSSFIFKIPSNC
jgi:signal transduction histidine kinase